MGVFRFIVCLFLFACKFSLYSAVDIDNDGLPDAWEEAQWAQ